MLSSIWNLLVTEDEILTKIITSFPIFIEAWLVLKLFTSILRIKYTKKQSAIYVILFPVFSLISKFFIPSPFNTLVNYIVMFILIKLVFKLNVIQSLLSVIIPTVIFALLGILVLKPILLIFNISVNQAQSTPIYEMLYLSILYTFVLILIKIINALKLKFDSSQEFTLHNKHIVIGNLVFGFFTLSIELAITAFYTDKLPFIITFLDFISLLAYFFISFYSLVKTMKLQMTTRDLENAENYNTTLSILYDNVKAFKHDFDNIIFTIGGFIDSNDMEGLKIYYNSLEKECQNINNISLLNPTLINNPGIYNLLTVKYQKAKVENVDIQLEFFFDLKQLRMPVYDFSRMFGIFLDNAIEASALSKEKIVKILFRDSSNSNVQIIQIENSYQNKNVNTKNIFEKGVTEKENHLGMGLWEVNKILKRNNNVNLLTEKNDNYFKQCLEIYY